MVHLVAVLAVTTQAAVEAVGLESQILVMMVVLSILLAMHAAVAVDARTASALIQVSNTVAGAGGAGLENSITGSGVTRARWRRRC